MGPKSRKTQDRIDRGDLPVDYRHGAESTKQSNGRRGRSQNEDWISDRPNDRHDDDTVGGRESPDTQTELGFDPYLSIIKDLKMKLKATEAVADEALVFYTQHQVEIQKVDKTRQELNEVTKKCNDYRITISSLQNFGREKEQNLAEKEIVINRDREELNILKEEVARHRQTLTNEKIEFENMTKKKEVEQLLKLQEERAKIESQCEKRYVKRAEDLEKATKKSQEDDRKKISDLQIKKDELAQSLEQQRSKLKDAEKKNKDIEKLRSLSETEVEDLSQRLKMAKNEFGLCVNSTKYFEDEFAKIQKEVQAISLRYADQIKDLDAAIHSMIEKVDADFKSVPISNTLVSKELCLLHFQRVISSQLHAILWQPFSSEITMQDQEIMLLNQIYDRLAKGSHEGEGSLRAARTFAALTIRSLHSQATSTKRVERFTNKIMEVLSLLVNHKLYAALRKDLNRLATSAISLWSIVQKDERELQVHSTLDPANFEKPEEDIDTTNAKIFILFPCVTARSCPDLDKARPVGPPGGWIDSKPELQFEEVYIHKGIGLPQWGQLVRAGEDEEDDRERKQALESSEKKKRELEEQIAALNNTDLGHKRKTSYSRRDSAIIGTSSPSSPTSVWLGANKIPERE